MEFKDRIKILRREKNMTQSQLAALLGKSEGAVRAWEIDRSKPDVDTLIILAKYFNCTTDYLLGLDDYRNEKEKNDIVALNGTLNEIISKMPNGKNLFENLVHFLEFTDMKDYEIAVFHFLKTAQLFLDHFLEMQKIRDKFVQSQSFDLSMYLDFVTNISTASAGANRLMHIISTVPIGSLQQQAEDYGSEADKLLSWKIYRAYYERFIYEIPTKRLYDDNL